MKTNDWRKEVLSGANVAQFQIYCSESVSCSLLLAAKGDNLVFLSSSDPGGRIFDGLKTIKRVFLLFNNNFIFIHNVSLSVYVCLCVWRGFNFSTGLKKYIHIKNIKQVLAYLQNTYSEDLSNLQTVCLSNPCPMNNRNPI